MFKRLLALSFVFSFIPLITVAAEKGTNTELTASTSMKSHDERLDRGEYLNRIALKERRLSADPSNKALIWDIMQDELIAGNLDKAEKYLKPLLSDPHYANNALYTQGVVCYLKGDYVQAEALFRKGARDLKSRIKLLYIYYQTGQYSKARELFDDEQLKSLSKNDIALLTSMSSFGSAQPYRLDWKADKAVLPFISMNNLPVVSVMVNGQPVNVFIDTGADLFVIKSEMAKTLGLTSQASFTGTYAGGKTAEINHSRLQTLGLGDVTLHDVPVDIADFPESWVFTDERTGKKIDIDGILSTGVFHQFLTTMDYPERQLVLMPRRKISQREVSERDGSHIPFILEGTHFMIVKGAVNGKEGMTFFLDSGLDDPDASILLQKEALNYAGLKLQDGERYAPDDNKGGLGGGGFAVTRLPIDSVSVGALHQKGLTGLYGVLPEQLYFTESGMILDGFLSHQFLRHYKWTIDFDAMMMTFQ
ncbi:aspartyl protease family protein [Klebsiella quasivariicola]|uniref:aspartyl protease family protein n=1 Tax=Klebsiella quasivariicola TaxID=2026240 RepID=UPI0024787E55|nr:aspartyl protease family protein [Klebsiella quasivariicola]